MLLLSAVQYYVPLKIGRTAGSIYLFEITGNWPLEHAKLRFNILWDILDLECNEVSMTLHKVKIELLTSFMMPFKDKFKVRRILKWIHYYIILC